MKRHKMKRGKSTDVNKSEHPLTNSCGPSSQSEPLPLRWTYTASTIAALAADLTSVAVPLVSTCVVAGVDALPLGQLREDLTLDLNLLLDGGAVEGPPADDGWLGFFTSAEAELKFLC